MTYSTIPTRNSNRSYPVRLQFNARRRLAGLPERDFLTDPLISYQVVRDRTDGIELPRQHSPQLLRAYRSKYEPHTGAKQIAKLSRRAFNNH